MLRIPCFYFCNLLLIESDKVTQSTGLDVNGILQYCLSGSILQCISDGAGSSRRTFHRHFQIEDTFFVFLFIKGSTYFIVSNILFGSAIQINIPFDATQTPHILTFQISTRTPSVHFQSNHIFAFIESVPIHIRLCLSVQRLLTTLLFRLFSLLGIGE